VTTGLNACRGSVQVGKGPAATGRKICGRRLSPGLRSHDWLALVANVAVVGGIVFLAIELGQNNELRVDAVSDDT